MKLHVQSRVRTFQAGLLKENASRSFVEQLQRSETQSPMLSRVPWPNSPTTQSMSPVKASPSKQFSTLSWPDDEMLEACDSGPTILSSHSSRDNRNEEDAVTEIINKLETMNRGIIRLVGLLGFGNSSNPSQSISRARGTPP